MSGRKIDRRCRWIEGNSYMAMAANAVACLMVIYAADGEYATTKEITAQLHPGRISRTEYKRVYRALCRLKSQGLVWGHAGSCWQLYISGAVLVRRLVHYGKRITKVPKGE